MPTTPKPRLDFAETYWQKPGSRVFDVAINGQAVLTNFDIVAAAGSEYNAIARTFTALADATGTIRIRFTAVAQRPGERHREDPTAISQTAIAAGAEGAVGGYQSDRDFTGGQTAFVDHSINTSEVASPDASAVYQNSRFGYDFSYVIPGLAPNAAYTVRLDFVETFWDDPGDRVFDVAINGQTVLSGFDILATAGGKFIAVAPLSRPRPTARARSPFTSRPSSTTPRSTASRSPGTRSARGR